MIFALHFVTVSVLHNQRRFAVLVQVDDVRAGTNSFQSSLAASQDQRFLDLKRSGGQSHDPADSGTASSASWIVRNRLASMTDRARQQHGIRRLSVDGRGARGDQYDIDHNH